MASQRSDAGCMDAPIAIMCGTKYQWDDDERGPIRGLRERELDEAPAKWTDEPEDGNETMELPRRPRAAAAPRRIEQALFTPRPSASPARLAPDLVDAEGA